VAIRLQTTHRGKMTMGTNAFLVDLVLAFLFAAIENAVSEHYQLDLWEKILPLKVCSKQWLVKVITRFLGGKISKLKLTLQSTTAHKCTSKVHVDFSRTNILLVSFLMVCLHSSFVSVCLKQFNPREILYISDISTLDVFRNALITP